MNSVLFDEHTVSFNKIGIEKTGNENDGFEVGELPGMG